MNNNKNRSNKARQLISEGKTRSEVCAITGLTRERVRQIVVFESARKFLVDPPEATKNTIIVAARHTCELQIDCDGKRLHGGKENFVALSIDGTIDDFFLACYQCVYKLGELSYVKRAAVTRTCDTCHKQFNWREGLSQTNPKSKITIFRCFGCRSTIKEARKTYWCYSLKLNACISCGANKRHHSRRGLCVACFSKKRYQTDPEFRAQLRAKQREYAQKRREKKLAANPKLWAHKYKLTACRVCFKNTRPHVGKGFCRNCYVAFKYIQKKYAKQPTRPNGLQSVQ